MKQIVIAQLPTLTADRAREVLCYDRKTGALTWRITMGPRAKAGAVAGSVNSRKKPYVRIIIDGHKYLAHRVAWLIVKGEWPVFRLDHENGIKSDNHWKNLRPVTNSQNLQNQRKAPVSNRSTGLLGASHRDGRRPLARITINKKTIEIGSFDTPREAHLAYIAAKRQLHTHGTL